MTTYSNDEQRRLDIESGEELDRIFARNPALQATPPILHINGSGKENLMGGYRKALDALHDAHAAVCQTAPHMRDYYILKDGAQRFHKASAEHISRLADLERLTAEFEALGIAVMDQS